MDQQFRLCTNSVLQAKAPSILELLAAMQSVTVVRAAAWSHYTTASI